jgi:hypothetical protein
MEEADALRRNGRMAGVALLCLGLIVAIGAETSDLADAKKKKVNRRVGTYRGTTEDGGTVSFRITRGRQVTGFTATNVRQRCYTAPLVNPSLQEQDKGTVTITAPPMRIEGAARFSFTNRPQNTSVAAQETEVKGKPDSSGGRTALKGNAFLYAWNGPQEAPGTEVCTTGLEEWTADKIPRKKK